MSRSFLFVPADSERKLHKAADSDADALILDLEDAVAASARPAARRLVAEFLGQPVHADRWVRINPLYCDDAGRDLEAVMTAAPDGIVLPKCSGAADVAELSTRLEEIEAAIGDGPGVTRILPIVTERPAALFRMQEYEQSSARLAALTWGAEDLSAAVGATCTRDASGHWSPPYELARSLCLFAAAAASRPAIDTVYTDFRDSNGLQRYAENARRDGFSGMLAIHPQQVAVINAAFTPTRSEVERATRVVRFFDEHPDAGVTQLDGQMIDRPHLLQARRTLELAARASSAGDLS